MFILHPFGTLRELRNTLREEPFSNKYKLEWGTFYLLIANFFATQIIGCAKELVVLL